MRNEGCVCPAGVAVGEARVRAGEGLVGERRAACTPAAGEPHSRPPRKRSGGTAEGAGAVCGGELTRAHT